MIDIEYSLFPIIIRILVNSPTLQRLSSSLSPRENPELSKHDWFFLYMFIQSKFQASETEQLRDTA